MLTTWPTHEEAVPKMPCGRRKLNASCKRTRYTYHAYKTWRESMLKGINDAHHPRTRGNFEYHTSVYHVLHVCVSVARSGAVF